MKNLRFNNIISKVNNLSPGFRTTFYLKSICIPIYPFVNIYFSSKIVDMLNTNVQKDLTIIVILAVILNFIFAIISNSVYEKYISHEDVIHYTEKSIVSKSLFNINYCDMENSNIFDLIKRYREVVDRYFSVYVRYMSLLSELICGVVITVLSISLLFPIFIINDVKNKSIIGSFWFPVLILVLILISSIIIFVISKHLSKKWDDYSDKNVLLNNYYNYFYDYLTDYKSGKEIRSYNLSEFIVNYSTKKIINEGAKLQRDIASLSAKSSSLIAIIGGIIGFGVYVFIGLRGSYGYFSLGKLVLYTGVFMQAVNGIMKIAQSFGKFSSAKKDVNLLNELLKYSDVSVCNNHYYNNDELSIQLKNITFRYPKANKNALENINLEIGNNEKIALVGLNGSGKSTLIKLLCGLYDTYNGDILLNGQNVKNNKICMKNLFSVVNQDFFIFSNTVKDNIIADKDFEDEMFKRSLEESGIYNKIMDLENKENTYLYKDLYESGIEISGGEAQKIAFARAIYRNAPVFILDEPTSALDPKSEYELYNQIYKTINNKSAIFVSHRLSSCRFCDKIIVLDNGKIVEEGTHKELLEKPDGFYKHMWDKQSKYYVSIDEKG